MNAGSSPRTFLFPTIQFVGASIWLWITNHLPEAIPGGECVDFILISGIGFIGDLRLEKDVVSRIECPRDSLVDTELIVNIPDRSPRVCTVGRPLKVWNDRSLRVEFAFKPDGSVDLSFLFPRGLGTGCPSESLATPVVGLPDRYALHATVV